eukprot:6311166-Amphidinium_carterae.1
MRLAGTPYPDGKSPWQACKAAWRSEGECNCTCSEASPDHSCHVAQVHAITVLHAEVERYPTAACFTPAAFLALPGEVKEVAADAPYHESQWNATRML